MKGHSGPQGRQQKIETTKNKVNPLCIFAAAWSAVDRVKDCSFSGGETTPKCHIAVKKVLSKMR